MSRSWRRRRSGPPRVLILLENLPLERDPRVRRECAALLESGFAVSVICPRGGGALPAELRGVSLHTYPAPPEARRAAGFVWEYLSSWVMTALLTAKLALTEGFDAIQVCNPPDTLFAIALPYRLAGVPLVFDHHDLTPEVFAARYDTDRGVVLWLLRALERATFASAAHVIATNTAFRRIALERGGKRPGEVTVVRNGPELAAVAPWAPRSQLDGTARDPGTERYLGVWIGTMFVDDGLELALAAIHHLVHALGRTDCTFAFVGDGEKRDRMVALARDLRIAPWVSFPGWLPLASAHAYLAGADLGLSPNPKSPRIDVSTSMKVMEYMAFELPVVAFDVDETRASAQEAAVYAAENDPAAYARLIDELLQDPARREEMGRQGRKRIEGGLSWDHQKVAYLEVYEALLRGVAS